MSVATGNWGCGSRLSGDPQLKLVIQWLAASLAGVPRLIYYTAGNSSLSKVRIEFNFRIRIIKKKIKKNKEKRKHILTLITLFTF